MSGFFIGIGETKILYSYNILVKLTGSIRAIMITWNSPKNRNSLSGEFRALSYHIFCDTWNHAWKTIWKVCVSAYETHQVLRMFLKY